MNAKVHLYNDDKPHRCPECHAVTDEDRLARRAVVQCCRCGVRFSWHPERQQPFLGVVCTDHQPKGEGQS